MRTSPPDRIVIHHDDYCASQIGMTKDGVQFFLTNPFVPKISHDNPGCEFVALYLFNQEGILIDARIDRLGPREEVVDVEAQRIYEQRLSELGNVEYCNISIEPFQIQRFGVIFGFIVHIPTHKDEEWYVTVEPGNYMAFHAPWDSGAYDT